MKHVRRREQSSLDRIIKGAEAGQYYLLLGPKVRADVVRISREGQGAERGSRRALARAR